VTIASAAHTAAPSFLVATVLRPSGEADNSSHAQFASELSELSDAADSNKGEGSAASAVTPDPHLAGTKSEQAKPSLQQAALVLPAAAADQHLTLAQIISTLPTTVTRRADILRPTLPAGISKPQPANQPVAQKVTATPTPTQFSSELSELSAPAGSPGREGEATNNATPYGQLAETVHAQSKPPEQQLPLVSLGPTANQQIALAQTVVTLPKTVTRPAESLRPTPPAGTSKRQVSSRTVDQKASAATTSAETLTVPVTPLPEIAATVTAVTDDPNNGESDIPLKATAPQTAPEQAQDSALPTVTPAAGTGEPTQEMAFATRVQPAQNSDRSTLPAEMASASAVASASKKMAPAAEDVDTAPAGTHAVLAATTNAIERDTQPATTSAPAAQATPAAHRTEAPALPADNIAKPSAPLKDISLQVNQPGKEPVDVRVVQQGSEVRVSVHSGDISLNSGLRQNLPELQSRLEETGYRSEMWRPGAAAAPVTAAPSAQASTNHSRGGDGQPQQQGGSQQEGGRRNPNQSNQPRWVEEMESSLGGEKSSGGFYGFSR